jgi:hypothetical protein
MSFCTLTIFFSEFGPLDLFELELANTETIMEKFKDARIKSKGLKFIFDIDDFGLINMTQAQLSLEYERDEVVIKPKDKTLTEKVLSFFGGKGEDSSNSTESQVSP